MTVWKGVVGRAFTPEAFRGYVEALGPAPAWARFVVLHNTAVPTLRDWHRVGGLQRMQGLERYYRDTQRWSAGPHLFVADDCIWVFTDLRETGVHSPSWNRCAFGVEMVGDYAEERFDSGPGAQVRDNTIAALAVLHHWAEIDSHTLRFHKSDPKTTHKDCPGSNVNYADMVSRLHQALLAF